MNAQDRKRITTIRQQADQLMYGTGNGILTSDIVESLLGDLNLILGGKEPEFLNDLIRRDEYAA